MITGERTDNMRVLFNNSQSTLIVAEFSMMEYDIIHRALFVYLSDKDKTEIMNTYIDQPQAEDLCRSALITGTVDLTPFGKTYLDSEYDENGNLTIDVPDSGLW